MIQRKLLFGWLISIYLIAAASVCVQAEESVDKPKDQKSFSNHHLGLFTGYAAKETKKRKEGFKIGVEYEYQFHKMTGVRGFVDYEAGDLDNWLAGVGLAFHTPKVPIIVFVGGAFELEEGKYEEFFRIAGEYKFKLNHAIFIAPGVGYDAGRRDNSVWFVGLIFGTSF
jgi:hypothetical protein